MPREGNSAGLRGKGGGYGGVRGKIGTTDPAEIARISQEYQKQSRENPEWIREANSVRSQDTQARRKIDEQDSLASLISNHEHFKNSSNYPYNPVMNEIRNRNNNFYNEMKNNNAKDIEDFYGKFDNPKYAGTPGVDNEENNSRRAMDMDAKARARQAARSRNNPTNPNDR